MQWDQHNQGVHRMTEIPKRPIRDMSTEEILYHLLKKQKGYYAAILDLTEQEERALFKKTPLQEVFPLVKKKGILMTCVEEINLALTPIKKRWMEKKDPANPFTAKVEETLENLNKELKKILEMDQMNQTEFQRQVNKMRDEQKKEVALSSQKK